MRIVGYIWRVVINLFYLAIVLFTLNELRGRTETLVISTLGIIYVTIRTIAWGQFIATLSVTAALQSQLNTIQARLDGTFDPIPADEIEAIQKAWHIKWIIDVIFLGIISLLCMLTFFTGLSKSS